MCYSKILNWDWYHLCIFVFLIETTHLFPSSTHVLYWSTVTYKAISTSFCSHSPLHLMGTYTTLFGRIMAVSPQLMISLTCIFIALSLVRHITDMLHFLWRPSSWYVLSLRVSNKCYQRGKCHLISHFKCLLCKRISQSVLCECVVSSIMSIPNLLVFTVLHKYNYQQITL